MFPEEPHLGRALTAMSLVASHINEVKRQHEDQLKLQGKIATYLCALSTSVSENTAHGRHTAAASDKHTLSHKKK